MPSQAQSEQFTVAVEGVFVGDIDVDAVFVGDRELEAVWLGRNVPLPGLEDWFLVTGVWDIDGSWADVAPWPLTPVVISAREISAIWRRVDVNQNL